jgi:steroid delta-isomerase-like uncharacterized protein
MGEQENKDLVQRFTTEVLENGNLSFAEELIADDGVDHDPLPGLGTDKAGAIETLRQLVTAFPDMKVEVHHVIASGDRVAVNSTLHATHSGDFMGIPATGKSVDIGGIDIIRVQDGKFLEHWGIFDGVGVMMQLGVIQPPPGS